MIVKVVMSQTDIVVIDRSRCLLSCGTNDTSVVCTFRIQTIYYKVIADVTHVMFSTHFLHPGTTYVSAECALYRSMTI